MGTKDIAEKSLEECADVFSDIVNVLLFEGKDVISPDDLVESSPYSNYTANGKIRSQERDISKFWNNSCIRIAAIGLENETAEEDDMPLRVIGYDGASYRAQLSSQSSNKQKKSKNNKKIIARYPVVSLVLYYGYKNKWRKAKTLHESLAIPDVLMDYVSDYKMNLFEIAYLDDEQIAKFTSDFKLVADYFVQMRKTGKYVAPDEEIVHVQEMLSLMTALLDDDRFVEVYEEVKGKERVTMCTVLDEVEARGEARGVSIGEEKTLNRNIHKLSDYLMQTNTSLSRKEAIKMAEGILKD